MKEVVEASAGPAVIFELIPVLASVAYPIALLVTFFRLPEAMREEEVQPLYVAYAPTPVTYTTNGAQLQP